MRAIIREMESFCWSLARLLFVARQKRIQIDGEDSTDLLFTTASYGGCGSGVEGRRVQGGFQGQMELPPLADKHEREPEEASPLGIILCTGARADRIVELDKSGIHVAEYLTSLPPRAVLGERLQQAAERARLQRKTDSD